MKNTILLLFSLLTLFAITTSNAQKKKYPVISFQEKEHDFGTISRGNPVSTEFVFTNTGNAPLVISKVRSSCGCTVPEKPKDPVMPGKTGKIKVTYNSSGMGNITKAITLTTNTKTQTETVLIKANVKEENK